jgi:hypothetical protein
MSIKAFVIVALAAAGIICGAVALYYHGGGVVHSWVHAIHGRR